jgi:hypothetical protein
MKKVFLLISVASFSIASFSQTQQTKVNKIYVQAGAGSSSHNGSSAGVSIEVVFKKNWIGGFSLQNLVTDPSNVPPDYRPRRVTVFPFSFDESPTLETNIYNLTAGKCFKAGQRTWFSTEAGISYVKSQKVNYTPNNANNGGWNIILFGEEPSNYTTTIENRSAMGGVLKADFTWAFASIAGLGAGVYTNINSIQSTVGFELKLSIGWMNIKKRHSN